MTALGSYGLTAPCSNCPFKREGGIRLTTARIHEIAGGMLSTAGSTFVCHKTAVGNDGPHCAGALVFAEKNGNATQMMRIAERIGLYDARKLRGHDDVFDDLDEMLETALPQPKRKRS